MGVATTSKLLPVDARNATAPRPSGRTAPCGWPALTPSAEAVNTSRAGLPADAVKSTSAGTLDVALVTAADQPVGFDVTATPPGADVRWELFLDDGTWPQGAVFAGPFGLFDARVAAGLASEEAREDAFARTLPEIDPSRDLGMFVVREQASAYDTSDDLRASPNSGAAQEMDRLLHEWGYAHGPSKP